MERDILKKNIRIVLLLIALLLISIGCGKSDSVTIKEMVNEIHKTPTLDLPLKKELGDVKFNGLMEVAALAVRSIYDFPVDVSVEQRLSVIDSIFIQEQKELAVQRAKDVSNTYQKCVVSIQGVHNAQKGTFEGKEGYEVELNSIISTEKGNENVVFRVLLLVNEDGALKVFWTEPKK